jgi:hypothetical protein
MNTIKNKVRSQLINKKLEPCLKFKIKSYEPDLSNFQKTWIAITQIDVNIYFLKALIFYYYS